MSTVRFRGRAIVALLAGLAVVASLASAGPAVAADGDLPFTSTPIPVISAPTPVVVGSLLSTSRDGWAPRPDSVDYQWLDDGVAIPDATNSYYYPTTTDVGHDVSVQLTAHKAGYLDTTETSAVLRVEAPTAIAGGLITGTVRVGYGLSFINTGLTPSDATLTYRWSRYADLTRTLSTQPTYTPVAQEAGDVLKLSVTATAPGYVPTTTDYSTQTVLPATMTASAFVTAYPVVGIPAEVDDYFWSPYPTTRTYQWKANKHAIHGATSNTYTPKASDAGKYLTVTETGSRDGFGTKTYTTGESGPVRKNFSRIPTPTITGVAMVGSVLTAHTTAWKPAAKSYTYTWYVGGAAEGSGPTFTPFDNSDAGQLVTVVVNATSSSVGPASSPHSLPTAPIARGQVTAGTVGLAAPVLSNDYVCASLKGWAQTTYWMVYKWYINGILVDDAYDSCYRLPADSVGETVTLTAGQDFPDSPAVLATSKGYTIGRGEYGPSTLGIQIVGAVKVGSTLSIDESYWTPEPTHFLVRWYKDSVSGIHRIATGSTFKVTSKYQGKEIFAKVHGSGPLLNTGLQYTQTFTVGPRSAPARAR